ncbi:UvrD-helicase domain-containing protein [soil metagenome]
MSRIEELLADLTPAQQAAVMHVDGPLLVLAGAGSGKTRVITRRVAYLLGQGIRPSNVLAITFTNKAAREMRNRVEAIAPGSPVWVSTFHSFGARVLRQYADRLGLDRNFTIYDQDDRNRIVKSALEAANVDNVHYSPERVQSAISRAKNQLLRPPAFAAKAHDFFDQVVAKVYPYYEKKLRDANALDFDDLLMWPALALMQDPELRAEMDARFRYVLVDEYQDTNQAQYAIVRGLSRDHPNICVVGDPDQSIYKWRGSDIRNILDFERDFPDTRVLTLDRNYRSTKRILRAADSLIANNRQRKPKTLETENPVGETIVVSTYETSMEESEGVAEQIRRMVTSGSRRYRDMAIFLRTNALSRLLETTFVKKRIPYQIVRGLAFFDRKENRDVLAYLRLLLNPRDDLSFMRAVNEPARGIGKTSLGHLQAYAEPREINLLAASANVAQIPAIKGKAAKALADFAKLMHELQPLIDMPPGDVIRQVLDRTGYRRSLLESSDAEDQERLANVEELITAAVQFSNEDSSRTLGDFLENITLASDVDGWDEQQDCVSIMTYHAAKGLEFPVVFMIAMEQGILPHERSLAEAQRTNNAEELEEERRLAFVGVTRAMEELYLSHAKLREYRGRTLYAIESIFLNELPDEGVERVMVQPARTPYQQAYGFGSGSQGQGRPGWIDADALVKAAKAQEMESMDDYVEDGDLVVGMLVRHEQYGVGKITEVRGSGVLRRVKVRFSAAGERTFVADKVKLAILPTP